jgi:hypothetical protein
MKKLMIVLFVFLAIGCANRYRTVYVPQGDAVKLRETLKNVDVWIKPVITEKPIPGNMTIYEGWY